MMFDSHTSAHKGAQSVYSKDESTDGINVTVGKRWASCEWISGATNEGKSGS